MVIFIAMNNRMRELIKKRMGEKNISQVDLADRLSMTSSQISRILSGDRGTTLENLIALADVLQIDRSLFLRVAAGLNPEPDKDPWVESNSHKLKLIPPNLRPYADKFIDSMIEDEQPVLKSKTKIKPAKP
jgi:transcriptional regulator with XRE-family HTH domain